MRLHRSRAELIRFWGMPNQIEQAIRHQQRPNEAGEFNLHASIVYLAGAGHPEQGPTQASKPPAFHAFALSCTQFNPKECPALLKEAQGQLHDTLAFIYPLAKAA